ncbi:Rad17 cell cycle checkpoint protein-domain-containing protein [Lophiotrema nucula]|uniref:Rad17 cell cycle checkpoint protein-domain-containing protein n=1 Tax=Lophiotrema nucula TaxID=690887 RepID=A0A6A5ZHD8_9PLEO|nr:Rad17 cell cycle checkpoint protein-domain-containing protein [Lophiotrema nucula]
MGKPRAARKQPIVVSSDEDDGRYSPPPKRPKRGTLMSISQNGAREDSKASRSQTKRAASPKRKLSTKSPSKSPSKPKPIYKPITSFFSNVSQPQLSQPTPSPEKPTVGTPIPEEDDILDSGDELPVKQPPVTAEPPSTLAVRKRSNDASRLDGAGALKGSQRFLRATNGSRNTPPPSQSARSESIDNRPWNEKYGPVALDELAVHKKKVSDVRTWLSDVFSGGARKRLLLLKGPAGSGKTTTISLLSKELGIDVHEWRNPTGSTSSSEGFVSVTAQFQDFVGRTGAFGSLAFDESSQNRQSQPLPTPTGRQRQLILVEEFPNTFTRTSSTVQSFRSAVLNYLAANTPSATSFFSGKPDPDEPVTPIVMIVSETLLSTNTAAADSFTAHRLLGPEILTHPGVTVIEFNPIAPTFMTKALEQIVLKEARKSGRRKTAGPQVIQRLSELGDVRSAVSSLEFLCLRGDEEEGWGAKIAFTKKKGQKDVPMTKMEQESLEMVTQRESTLGIFHAVGKVVHNKRYPEDLTLPQPPNWFPERRRPKPSEVRIETLIDELGTDTQTFIAALHENYVLSCQGADSEETMDSIDGCIDALSDADLLSPDRFSRRNFAGTTTDTLRQDEMSFQTSVRGLLYSLPSPVKRIAPPPGVMGTKGNTKGSAFVMYYPASLRIWRQQEEIGGLLDLWISRIQKGEIFAPGLLPAKPSEGRVGGVETWKRSTPFSQSKQLSTQTSTKLSGDEPLPPVLLGSGGSARFELLLERLPYLQVILRRKAMPSPSTSTTLREIQKITSFNGSTMKDSPEDDDDPDEEDAGEQEQWATDKPGSETPRKKRKTIGIKTKEKKDSEMLAQVMEKDVANLALSDDDIED